MVLRLLVAAALVSTFFAGWVVGGLRRPAGADPAAVGRLEQQVATLQARLRVREGVAASRRASVDPAIAPGGSAASMSPYGSGASATAARIEHAPAASAPAAARPDDSLRATRAVAPTVQAALDRFYRYVETSNTSGPERWRQARQLVEELRAMGPPAGQALMHVLATGSDTDERRAAARLLGQLQVAEALPLLRDVVDKEQDVLLRRAAASGLRQLQTPESVPVMERLVTQPAEDRFVRLSAAVGLAESGRPLGVAGLVHIFEEAAADGRGRDMAFRALNRLGDERALPFMRQLLGANVEPSYRLQAIRYVMTQNDQQALPTLQALTMSPTEQPSIRDAAAQALSSISRR